MTLITTASQAKTIVKRINTLRLKLRGVLRELCGKDDLRATAWYLDRADLAESLRGRIRDEEQELADLTY